MDIKRAAGERFSEETVQIQYSSISIYFSSLYGQYGVIEQCSGYWVGWKSTFLYVLDDNEVIIKDIRTKKCAYFTGARWKRLVSEIDAIDKHVECAMVEKTTAYHQHIGGTWHISVDQLSYGWYPSVVWNFGCWESIEANTHWYRIDIY